jgi:hypothetical protein
MGWWPAWQDGISQLSTGERRSCGHLLLISAANGPEDFTSPLCSRVHGTTWHRFTASQGIESSYEGYSLGLLVLTKGSLLRAEMH